MYSDKDDCVNKISSNLLLSFVYLNFVLIEYLET